MPLNLDTICLFLDVDGTLLDIAARPGDVVVPPSLVEDLHTAERRLGGALALVSGRSIEDLDTLFAPLRLRATGVHGAEIRFSPDEPILHDEAAALPEEIWRAVRRVAAGFPGVILENKRYSFGVHYRSAPHVAPALEGALRSAVAAPWDLILLPGHCVFEVKRAAHDKGRAIGRFMEQGPFAGRRPIFAGDDTTDRPGFAAVRARGGLAYSVGQDLPCVTGSFAAPAAVRAWLGHLVRDELVKP
ncbi:MAG: trehalose-phosphatase [Methylobacteriaceae bacterium]|nr:trehalose-phosphatase [Methylobacteriaceae bacterium]